MTSRGLDAPQGQVLAHELAVDLRPEICVVVGEAQAPFDEIDGRPWIVREITQQEQGPGLDRSVWNRGHDLLQDASSLGDVPRLAVIGGREQPSAPAVLLMVPGCLRSRHLRQLSR